MANIPTQEQNPKGLHAKYYIQKIKGWKQVKNGDGFEPRYEAILKPVDKNAEYFILRLDTGGSDINHIKACRIGINAYADAIEPFIPELAKDLRERYPLFDLHDGIAPEFRKQWNKVNNANYPEDF